MDIDDTLYGLREALEDGDIERARDLFDGMDSWFIKSGYLPEDWANAHPIN